MAKVTVIIPVYGVERYIERCCLSVFNQSFRDFDIVFVNDCSQDRSEDIVTRVIAQFQHTGICSTLIRHATNQGISAARETGLRAATGEWILYVDSDDHIAPTMLEAMVAASSTADIVYCDYYESKHGQLIYRDQLLPTVDPIDLTAAMLQQQIVWAPWNKLFKKSLADSHDLHWPSGINIGEDMVVMSQLFYHAGSIAHVPEGLYVYNRDNTGSYLNNWNSEQCEQNLHAVTILAAYLSQQPQHARLAVGLSAIKLMARFQMLYSPERALIKRVRQQFAETDGDIFTYRDAAWHWKIIMYLICRQSPNMGLLIIDMISLLKRCLSRPVSKT